MSSSDKPSFSQLMLGNATVTVGEAPTTDSIRNLKRHGVTHIVTLLGSEMSSNGDADDAVASRGREIESLTTSAGLHWRWFPYTNTLDSTDTELELLRQYVQELAKLVTEGKHLYIHCDASQARCMLLVLALLVHRRIPVCSAYPMLHGLTRGQANSLSRAELQWAISLGGSVR